MTTTFRIAVFISGRGSNLMALHKYIKNNKLPIEICLVLSDKKDAAGLVFAKENGIKTQVVLRKAKEQTNIEFNTAIANVTLQHKPDLVVLAGFMRVLSSEFIQKFPMMIINIHPALLPSFKGLHAQEQALKAGVKFTGATVHFVVEEVDDGPIIAQSVVPVFDTDTLNDLEQRILETEHQLLPKAVEAISTGRIKIDGRKVIISNTKNYQKQPYWISF